MRTTIRNKTLKNEVVYVDKISYEDCVFVECEYVYSGGFEISFKRCKFNGGVFVFTDAAECTLKTLSHFYQQPGLKKSVKMTLEKIKSGAYIKAGPPQPRLSLVTNDEETRGG